MPGVRRWHSYVWLMAVLLPLIFLKLSYSAGNGPYGLDASYYFQIARHVMNGDGLLSSVSLYREGLILPARATIYPLWPLVLGYTARAIGLVRAANVLPPLLYVIDLILLFQIARAVRRSIDQNEEGRWPASEHLVVALFGTNVMFFSSTSHPYTEGLAFAMGFTSLLCLNRFWRTGSTAFIAACGIAAGLAFLARTQMVGIAIGISILLLVLALRDRSLVKPFLVFCSTAAAVVMPWILFLGYVPGAPFVAPWRTAPAVQLPPFEHFHRPASAFGYVAEWLEAFRVMFDTGSDHSYIQSFGIAALLVPVAAAVLLFEARWRRCTILPMRDHATAWALIFAGGFFFVTLTLYHGQFFLPWFFGWRHGLPLIFLLTIAVIWLRRHPNAWISRGATAAVLISLITGSANVLAFVRNDPTGPSAAEVEALRWTESSRQHPVLMTTNAQVLSAYSAMARFHWTICETDPKTTQIMIDRLGIDYVLVYEWELPCPFLNVSGGFQVVAVFGESPRRIFVFRPRAVQGKE
jgi:hypothetical protein